jgi:hypothetical protein
MSSQAIAVNEMPHDERRTTRRKALQLRAVLTVPPGRTLQSQTIDVSAGGICVGLPFELTNDDECTISLDLLGDPIEISGRVCYCVATRDGFRVGMQFVRMDQKIAQVLESALS